MQRLPSTEKLSAELQKIKTDLEFMLETNLNKIEENKAWTWTQKQKAATLMQQAYEKFWLERLSEAGIVVSPVFEANTKETSSEKTLCEEFKVYENLWR